MGAALSVCVQCLTACHDRHLERKYRFDNGALTDPQPLLKVNNETSSIFVAIQDKNTEEVQRHLDLLKEIAATDPDDWTPVNSNSETPLHLACRLGFLAIANLLLDSIPHTRFVTSIGTPVHSLLSAVRSGHVSDSQGLEFLPRLLESGCHVNDVDEKGESALYRAISQSNLPFVEGLILYGASYNLQEYANGFTPLHMAAFQGHITCLYALLDLPDISLDTVDNQGRSALLIAMLNILDWVKHEPRPNFLYTTHAMPNEPVLVSRYNRIAVVEALLNAGADPNLSHVHRRNPLIVSHEILALELARYGSAMGYVSPDERTTQRRPTQESIFAPMVRLLVICGGRFPDGHEETSFMHVDWIQRLYEDSFCQSPSRRGPHDLMHLSRQAIRCQLGKVSKLHCVGQLPLPDRMLRYVQI